MGYESPALRVYHNINILRDIESFLLYYFGIFFQKLKK